MMNQILQDGNYVCLQNKSQEQKCQHNNIYVPVKGSDPLPKEEFDAAMSPTYY